MNGKPEQLFEYLYAVHELQSPPIRDYKRYEKSWTPGELPDSDGCYLFGTGDDEEAWLEVHKQKIDYPRKPNKSFKNWLNSERVDDERKEPKVQENKRTKLVSYPDIDEEDDSPEYEYFEDDPNRVSDYNAWLKDWRQWARKTKHKRRVQKLYAELFTLYQEFQREGDVYELAFGHGLLTLRHDPENVNRPVMVTSVELDFKSAEGVFCLKPTQKGTHVETDMLSNIDGLSLDNLEVLKKTYEENDELDPLASVLSNEFYRNFVQTIHADGYFEKDSDQALSLSKKPTIYNQSVIFLRKRGAQLWKEDLQKTITNIKNSQLEVPKTIQALTTEDVSVTKQTVDEQQKWEPVSEKSYFPLPANEEQKEIVGRLSNNIGVTVQGPPGTGKSHTIANLISNFLAHGKRVLVTSQTEKALSVLSDKVPDSIRALCVPYLGGDGRSIREIEGSINQISEKMGTLKPDILEKEIQQDEEELHNIRRQISKNKHLMKEWAQKENHETEWHHQRLKPQDAGQFLNETEVDYSWIRDELDLDTPFPLTADEFNELWGLKNQLRAYDLPLREQYLPRPADLMTIEDFSHWVNNYRDYEEKVSSNHETLKRYHVPVNERFHQQLNGYLESVLRHKDIFEREFLNLILEDSLVDSDSSQRWYDFTNDMMEKLRAFNVLESELLEYDFNLPQTDINRVKQDLQVLKERYQKNEPNMLFWLITGRKIKYLKSHPIIDGRVLQSTNDIEIVEKHIQLNEQKDKIIKVWNRTIEKIIGPNIQADNQRFAVEMKQILTQIETALSLVETAKSLQYFIKEHEVNLEVAFNWSEYNSYQKLYQMGEMLKDRLYFDQIKKRFEDTLRLLERYVREPHAHPIVEQFNNAFKDKNTDHWKYLHQQLQERLSTKQNVIRLFELLTKLDDTAPLLAEDVKASLDQSWSFPKDYLGSWAYRQLDTWLIRLDRYQPDKLQGEIHQLQKRESQMIENIVANSTWKQQIERITEPQKRSLQAWKRNIKRIGKGTGRYATQFRKQARKEMATASEAIPVWIMPTYRVLENFSVDQEKFDVVIVDESSQCDIFSLQVLLRAEKAVIVGDDEQISPSAVGVNQEQINGLIRRHLPGIPRNDIFDMKTSLYELSDQIFPKNARLMLKEHFRSVPEIIQFSNDLSYDGNIVPLRLPTSKEKLHQPVLTRFVSEGYREEDRKAVNIPEAEAIVEDIKKMIEDPRFEDQTMGVISLQANDQARYIENKLREVIGEEEMVKRRLISGDAYAFQGDERDIMLLSMVVAQNKKFKAITDGAARQRFNVAASRARNQMRLYHSVRLDDLNPEDMRSRLLNYCQHPSRTIEEYENVVDMLESPLEKDVAKRIISRGYRITPQLKVGKYRIDMVVEGLNQRLAVECDGDRWHGMDRWVQDKERQYVLERAGWTFWRVRGSTFYRNPEKAMQTLWARLEIMKIQPLRLENV
jgi:superfamily I DNA and/or RNA helicase/very-short-patch-repair endonuclease